MNNLVEDLKILSFKVIFQCPKFLKTFQFFFCEDYLIMRPTFTIEMFWKLTFKVLYLVTTNVPNFVDSDHNFVKSDDNII